MLEERSTPWGEDPEQPTDRCVAHLISIVINAVEINSAGSDNLELTPAEVSDWMKRNVSSSKSK